VLQLVEEALDEIALTIDRVVDGAMNKPAAEAWDVRPCSGLADKIENRVAVVAAVGNHVASGYHSFQQVGDGALVVRLSGGQTDADR